MIEGSPMTCPRCNSTAFAIHDVERGAYCLNCSYCTKTEALKAKAAAQAQEDWEKGAERREKLREFNFGKPKKRRSRKHMDVPRYGYGHPWKPKPYGEGQ
jgi:hypothetical protein